MTATLIPNASTTQPKASTPSVLHSIPGGSGLMVGIATIGGILLADSKLAPIILALIGFADLSQLVNVLENKTGTATTTANASNVSSTLSTNKGVIYI